MVEKLKKMYCGECGNEHHIIFTRPTGELLISCFKCQTITEVEIEPAKIRLSNYSGMGMLCIKY